MSGTLRDRITGFVIMLVAVAWCWAVIDTIPAADDASQVGARGFPLGMGLLLLLLGFTLLASAWFRSTEGEQTSHDPSDDEEAIVPLPLQIAGIAAVLLLIAVYVYLLDTVGFIAATFLTVALGTGGVLRIWRPGLILGLSAGMALGIYILFGKVLGVYLPHGSWFDLTF
ncbi:MAG: tripartite tricarboxylate transporter TctB family protein [Hyphomicrobiaceae bacterium]